jgi:branched-chain amino acid aminotransferase
MKDQIFISANGNGQVRRGPDHRQKPTRRKQQSTLESDYVWLDGELVPFENATVHFLNPTLHYGPGVFEGIRCYNTPRGPAVFRLGDHLERFIRSAAILGVDDLQYDGDELRDIVCRVIQVNSFSECYIRPALYFEGPLGLDLAAYRPVIGVAAWKWTNYLGKDAMKNGIRMMVSSITRMHPNASMTKAKINGQYVNSVLAKTLAAKSGFDEAIMLDPEGYVAEATGENLLLVRNNTIYTTPRAEILEGITRDTVITLARDAGYTVVEERISRDQLYIADEVFVCGTAAEVQAVREIDFRRIGAGRPGPVSSHLKKLFSETINGENRRSAEWLDYVVLEPMV